MSGKEWLSTQFVRRHYTYENSEFDTTDPRRMRILFELAGRQVADFQIREPGVMACISLPNEQGVIFDLLQPGGVLYHDLREPGTPACPPVDPWQLAALRIDR